MIALKPHPDLLSCSTIGDTLELRKRKTREKHTASFAICVVPILVILGGTGCDREHNVSSILTNFPDETINPLEMRRHADLPIRIVGPIEVWWFARTTLDVAFMDHGPIKVE